LITGSFSEGSGRPLVEGKIILPRLAIEGDVSFLMDTGADSSVLMPSDAKNLGIPYDLLEGNRECGGIGGTVHSFVERAILVFSHPNRTLYGYDLEIDIMPYDVEVEEVPSLLGRDVLDRWRIVYDPQGAGLRAKPRSADITIDLTKSAGTN
jgi:predicted aspartyl protease